MRQNWQMEAEARLKSGRHKRIWKKVVQTLACIVVFCTTYALILPAITMERQTYCGLAEHTHSESCGGESIHWSCEAQWETHHHRAVCFDEEGNLICGTAETLLHTHNAYCYGEDGRLLCPLTEAEAHVHGAECYAVVRGELLCDLPESEGHVHGDGCLDEAGALVCDLPESEGHVHDDLCFVCTEELVCTLAEAQEHTHDEGCYDESGALVCGILSAPRHDHDESCLCTVEAEECTLPEHEHTDKCYIDPAAAAVMDRIDALPDNDEIDATLTAYEEAEDLEGLESWYAQLLASIQSVKADYDALTAEQQAAVTNADKLLALAELTGDWDDEVQMISGKNVTYQVWLNGDWRTVGTSAYRTGMVKGQEYAYIDSATAESFFGEYGYTAATDPATTMQASYNDIYTIYYLDKQTTTSNGTTTTKYVQSNYCMDVKGDSVTAGTLIQLYTANSSAAQKFRIFDDGSYSVISPLNPGGDGKRYYVNTSGTSGEQLKLSAELNDGSCWRITTTSGGVTKFTSARGSNLLIDLDDYNQTNGTKIQAYQNGKAINWRLVQQYAMEDVTSQQQEDGTYLIGLRPESNGSILVRYTPAGTVQPSAKPTTIQGADTRDLIEVNLYDYGTNINDKYNSDKKYPGFQQDNGTTGDLTKFHGSAFNFGNNITSDLAAGLTSVTQQTTGINSMGANRANEPISGAIKDTLVNGYPALADGTSLSYLFSQNTYATKKNTQSVNGLFLYNDVTGAYTYNSRNNHAQFNAKDNTFTLYEQVISSNFMMYPFGNFLPFNDINTQATQASTIDKVALQAMANRAGSKSGSAYQTLKTKLGEFIALMDNAYGTGKWTAKDCVNKYFEVSNINKTFTDESLAGVYSINYDEATDFYFGMEMKMNFMQPKGGLTGKDGKQPMQFTFSGDDDVWVYIDGKLFLDLSGIHRHVGGEIDFVKGEVRYYTLDVATGDVSEVPYKTVPFSQLVDRSQLNDAGTFKDYSQHSFNMYYMERGAGSGVCRMNFNFPVLRRNAITVGKELTTDSETIEALGDPDFRFRVMKADGSAPFIAEGTAYHLFGADGKEIGSFGVYKTGPGGVFTLKAGQQAVFPDIEEDSGSYYVEELLDPGDYGQYGQITVRGESETLTAGNVVIDSTTFTGVKSPVRDMSSGSTLFCFENQISTEKLASLSITKQLEGYPQKARDAQVFDFAVTLDGRPLPVGTAYTVGGTTHTVEQEGIITLAPGETAVIPNILSGSQFTVTETEASAEGYTVTYQVNGTAVEGGAATGAVKTGTAVSVLVTNAEGGATVTIPVKKTLANPDGTARTYQFRLVQVKDNTGTTEMPNTEQLVSVTFPAGETGTLRETVFTLAYPMQSYPEGGTLYYKITEVPGTETDTFYDETVWLASVTLTRSGGTLTASPPVLWRSGDGNAGETAVSFRNVLAVYELPQTGGPGTFLFTLCGLGLTAAAVILLRARGRKKERGTA